MAEVNLPQRYSKIFSGILKLGWQVQPLRLNVKAVGWAGFHKGFNVLANMQKSF